MSESRSGGGAHQVGDTYGASPGQKIPGLLYIHSEEDVDAAGEYLNSFQRTAAAVGDFVNAVVTGPVSPLYGDPLQARGSFGGPEQRSASTSSARTANALSEGRTSTRWPPTAPAGARGRRRRRAAAADHGAPAPRSVADRPAIS